jgi:hypothetical protein
MSQKVVCPSCGSTVDDSNFCNRCGHPLKAPVKKAEDALVNLIQGATTMVSGTSKLISALGQEAERKAKEGSYSKDINQAIEALGKSVREMADRVDELSKRAGEKAEKKIRQRYRIEEK